MESGDDATFGGDIYTDVATYMLDGAPNKVWLGFTVSGLPQGPTDLADFLYWMDWPGFVTGTTNAPPVIQQSIPQSTGGVDVYGNSIESYKFLTTQIAANTTTGNIYYVVLAPITMTNNQVYSNIGISYTNTPTVLIATTTDTNLRNTNIGYSGINWGNTNYRVYSQSQNNGFNTGTAGVTDTTNNYFRGGTLI
jgi:hypothetical protein